jgi:hypothetical protein
MTFGHHGVFSLTPIWLFALVGVWIVHRRGLPSADGTQARRGLHWPILFLSAVVFFFYCCLNTERNYGGFCHGMRWLIWLTPLWLLFLPPALDAASHRPWTRWLGSACLFVSIFSATDAWYNPWNYSWLHRILFWFGFSSY